MELLKGKIKPWKKWLEPCFVKNNLLRYFWAKAFNTSCYIINRAMVRPILKKTPYELFKGKNLTLATFILLDVNVFVLNNGKDNLGKSLHHHHQEIPSLKLS